MAYYPYNPLNYPSNYYPQPVPDQLSQLRQSQMQQMHPQMIQPVPQTQPIPSPATQNSGIVWVSSKQEADSYLVAPGSAVALWDANNPVIYLRQADSTGKPSTKVYDLVERTVNQAAQQTVPQIDMNNIVTWDRLDEYLAKRLKQPVMAEKAKEDTEHE